MVLSMERWNGKVAVVTGASAGIGAAIAEHLVKHGMKVIGLARRVQLIEDNAKNLSAEKGELHGLKVDMTRQEEITNAFKIIEEKIGPVHVLINNAGVAEDTSLMDGDFELWQRTIDINVLVCLNGKQVGVASDRVCSIGMRFRLSNEMIPAEFYLLEYRTNAGLAEGIIGLCVATREAIKSMKRHDVDGHIIHINSISGQFPLSCPGVNVYSASKYAVTALTHDLTEELKAAGSKIKVTSLSPGMVDTETARRFHGNEMDKIPSLKTEDIAEAAVYALSTPPHVQKMIKKIIRKLMKRLIRIANNFSY